jgi:hypothetical protein
MRHEPDVQAGWRIPYRPDTELAVEASNLVDLTSFNTAGKTRFHDIMDTDAFETINWVIPLAINGSIHMAAWNFTFPSPTEQYLWRISCVVIASSPLIFLIAETIG